MEIVPVRPDRRLPDVVAIGSFLRGTARTTLSGPDGVYALGGGRTANNFEANPAIWGEQMREAG
jgi:hypothetical protein